MSPTDRPPAAANAPAFDHTVPLFRSHCPPSRDEGTALYAALAATDERVLVESHVVDTWGSDCVLVVTNRRFRVARLSSLFSVLVSQVPKRLIDRIPVVGGLINGLFGLMAKGIGKLTKRDERVAQKVAEAARRALLDAGRGEHGLLSLTFSELCARCSEVTLDRKRWMLAGKPSISFTTRKLLKGLGTSDLQLPDDAHYEIYEAYAKHLAPWLESRGAAVRVEEKRITIELPSPA